MPTLESSRCIAPFSTLFVAFSILWSKNGMTQDDPPQEKSIPQKTLTTPLQQHPQLIKISTPLSTDLAGPNHVEYRVHNWRRLPSGRVVRGDGWGLTDLLLVSVIIYWIWSVLVIWFFCKSKTIIYQSAEPFAGLGLQISTTRGLSIPTTLYPSTFPAHRLLIPMQTSRLFIPLQEISTVIVNEGLTRWSVRYYLAIVKKEGQGIVVAYDHVRQPLSVWREIYHEIREALFNEYSW